MVDFVSIDTCMKLVKKVVIYKLDLIILNDDHRMFKSIKNKLVQLLAMQLCIVSFNEINGASIDKI